MPTMKAISATHSLSWSAIHATACELEHFPAHYPWPMSGRRLERYVSLRSETQSNFLCVLMPTFTWTATPPTSC
jgi:hypothetical protein